MRRVGTVKEGEDGRARARISRRSSSGRERRVAIGGQRGGVVWFDR
jgi:hypothetical protein